MNCLAKTGLCLLTISFSACSTHVPAPVDDIRLSAKQIQNRYLFSTPQLVNTNTRHKVLPGETLFAIAWKYSLDYHDMAKINQLNRFRIYPGQLLKLKEEIPKSVFKASSLVAAINSDVLNKKSKEHKYASTAHSKKKPAKSKTVQNIKINKRPSYSTSSRANKSITSRVANSKIKNWIWPVNGKILQGFSNKNNQNKGLDIKAKLGAAVRATAPGKVVYSGNGLRGYGQLVIIKHNDSYLSAYAHNNKIHVIENEVVKAGQRIADIGKSGSDKIKLHFEIRYKGKPVNPLNYLPKAG